MPANPPPGIPRRTALKRCAALGALALAARCESFAGWLDFLDNAPADVFPGDAPDDPVWEAWSARGWAREASHYIRLGKNVQCQLCPNNCLLKPGDRSHCRNRINRNGTLYTLAYGNPCAIHVDPVEKKPLYHFLPGSRTFSIATSGCVFRCLNCQNWDISQKKPEETKDPSGAELRLRAPLPAGLSLDQLRRASLFPEDIAAVAQSLQCASISYTYSEPTAYYEYARDCSAAARGAGVRNILVTCGSIMQRPLLEILAHVDAAHVDLKGFDDAVYRKLNSGKLQPILDTLKTYRDSGAWFEVIHLMVPTYTDRLETTKRMCDWMLDTLGPDLPLHLSRFHPQHRLTHLPPTPVDTLRLARDAARAAGLHYVYVGNTPEIEDAGTTICPGCRQAVIERDLFAVTRFALRDGACPGCGTPIAGVWS